MVVLLLGAVGTCSGNGSSNDDSSSSPQAVTEEDEPSSKKQPEVDKSSLQATVDDAATVTNDSYTDDTWNAFQQAIDTGRTVLADEEATQEDVDAATNNITTARDALQVKFDPANYETPSFGDVARNPDDWYGRKVSFTGNVLQVVECTDETDLRIATDGGYDDVILVGYDPAILNGTHVLEDDSVTIYGTCLGQYTYTSTLGASVSLPAVYADQVTINQ